MAKPTNGHADPRAVTGENSGASSARQPSNGTAARPAPAGQSVPSTSSPATSTGSGRNSAGSGRNGTASGRNGNGPSTTGKPAGRISTPTARTTRAARTAPTARSTPRPGRDDWSHRDVDDLSRRPEGRERLQAREHPQGRDRPPWRPVRLDATARATRPMSPSTRRMYQRRRRTMLFVFLLVSAIVLLVNQLAPDDVTTGAAAPAPTVTLRPATATGAPTAGLSATGTPADRQLTARPPKPAATTRSPVGAALKDNGFAYADTTGPVLGTAGSVRRFKVAVERGRDLSPARFAGAVDRVLGDPRSWIAGEQFRLQRVPRTAGAEFTVFLASAATSERMCARGGLRTAGYTSCRLAGQVIINLDRWEKAIPDYGAPLATYQAYAINHEVGHQLGHGHEGCPGAGQLAPVMQQQTYGLKGCTANAWPYVGGNRYAGTPVS